MLLYNIKSVYYNIKDWFRNCFNKNHFKTVWYTFLAKPWDHSFTYEVLKYRLIETREYFKKTNIIDKESADEIVREIDLALSLYDIMSDQKSAGHWEYTDAVDETIPAIERMVYIPDRYVNIRNAHRFFAHQHIIDYCKERSPSYLYEEKARKLFWRVIEQYSQNWCD